MLAAEAPEPKEQDVGVCFGRRTTGYPRLINLRDQKPSAPLSQAITAARGRSSKRSGEP
jgi:hypothetical protein